MTIFRQSLASLMGGCVALPALAQFEYGQTTFAYLEEIEIVGTTPMVVGQVDGSEPFHVQVFSAEDLEKVEGYSVSRFLDRQAASVSVNDAQNNVLQPDIRFRGYSASPLLGVSQGVAVYFSGVRINESFGDTVNWDLLPASAVKRMGLVAGSNPIYGQNALGGALVMEGKNAFNTEDGELSLAASSWQGRQVTLADGVRNEHWGLFVSADYFAEDGWRDYSDSEAASVYSVLSNRHDSGNLDLSWLWADTRMQGNGASPTGLLEQDREAVFTHPDRTENRLNMFTLNSREDLSYNSWLAATIFYRDLQTDSFNGDGSDNEECPGTQLLCEEEGGVFEQLEDQFGRPVSAGFDAINNISRRDQQSWGASLQWNKTAHTWGGLHHLGIGGDYFAGRTRFTSGVEYAALTEERSTTRSGLYNPEEGNRLDATQDMFALWISDTIEISEQWQLLLGLRYNRVKVSADDRSGQRPELTATHHYNRLNGGAGLSWSFSENMTAYAGLYQTSRAPSPVELACSHEDAPCNLPNTFLADPPLKDIVARSAEVGLRGRGEHSQWHLGLFHTRNRNDIHFQTTGGVSSNQGFFRNIGDTVFQGVEASYGWTRDALSMEWQYSWVEATYRDEFQSFSPNHPDANGGALPVESGNHLPGIPEHTVRWLLDYQWSDDLQSGFDVTASSGVYLRGDEANLDERTDSYWVANAWVSWQLLQDVALKFEVSNLFDREYERFGLYGEPDEVIDNIDDDPRFLSPAAPRSLSLSLQLRW
ncbi:TonB-dependent receptor [Pseudomaricurvus sp. HS19]|uniref:TonB-dependent receptor n=1 Tax=Pseudomaricurvus sp. HS19 TaxID=2692626 RepID=UPI0013716202|nr:TonB-dependent receptor [Pseudomaricurvus sp. HS19]MYM64856.1 TonB-dependent receptor [Pseudomaricurvus sp. HS19]